MKHACTLLLTLLLLPAGVFAHAASRPAPKEDSATRQIVLLRHGESVWNKEDRFTGWSEPPLTDKGIAGALKAGELLKREGFTFDAVHTSYLSRAIKTTWLALEGMDLLWIPVRTDWRLNERCYGDLEGKTRQEAAAASSPEQVHIWRRSFDIAPPPLADNDPRSPAQDPKYRAVPRDKLPRSESLKDTIARTKPYWKRVLAPALRSGKNILVVGHNTSLRALSKCIDEALGEKDLEKLELPNTTPVVYTLDANLKPISRRVLGESGKPQ